jgi:hypothetical protein
MVVLHNHPNLSAWIRGLQLARQFWRLAESHSRNQQQRRD